MIKELTIEHLVHKNSPRIFLRFEKDAEAIQLVRNKLGAMWSNTKKAWHISPRENYYELLSSCFNPFGVKLHIKENTGGQIKQNEKIQVSNVISIHLSKEVIEKLGEFEFWMKSRR